MITQEDQEENTLITKLFAAIVEGDLSEILPFSAADSATLQLIVNYNSYVIMSCIATAAQKADKSGDWSLFKSLLDIEEFHELLDEKIQANLTAALSVETVSPDQKYFKIVEILLRSEDFSHFAATTPQFIIYVFNQGYQQKNWAIFEKLLGLEDINRALSYCDIMPFLAQKSVAQWDIVSNILDIYSQDTSSVIAANPAFADGLIFILQNAAYESKPHIIRKILDIIVNSPGLSQFDISTDDDIICRLAAESGDDDMVYLMLTKQRLKRDKSYNGLISLIIESEYAAAFKNIAINSAKELNRATSFDFSPLMIAAARYATLPDTDKDRDELKKIIIAILEHDNIDITITNKYKYNFLNIASKAGLLEDAQILQLLSEKYNTQEFRKKHDGKNLLHVLIESGVKITPKILEAFSDCLNELDDSNSSPLSYALFVPAKAQANGYILQLLDADAKFIRNGIESPSQLHLAILCANDDQDKAWLQEFLNNPGIKGMINTIDQTGKTPLHYAMMLGKNNLAKILVASGARNDLQDQAGFIPSHYSYLKEAKSSPWPATTTELMPTLNTDLLEYFAKFTHSISAEPPEVTTILHDMLQAVENDKNLEWHQKVFYIAWIKSYFKDRQLAEENLKSIDIAVNTIISKEFSDKNKYPDCKLGAGRAIGVESEIPEFRPPPYLTIADIEKWFSVKVEHDKTVHESMLSTGSTNKMTEIISDRPITTSQQYYKFLALHQMLKIYGSRVNQTSGGHVHINAWSRAETDKSKALPPYIADEQRRLAYLKFVLLNFIRVEPLLLGFLRGGIGMDPNSPPYNKPLGDIEAAINACTSIDALIRLTSHGHTIDLTALDKHGTTEFRMHEGIVDPILWNAWVDCITRLVSISKEQAMALNDPERPQKLHAMDDIEQLVYLLMTMRQYNKTWDPKSGATSTADIPATLPYQGTVQTPAQIQIQKAPLYQMMELCLETKPKELELFLSHYIISNKNRVSSEDLKQLLKLVEFTAQHPGFLANKIDPEVVKIVKRVIEKQMRIVPVHKKIP